MKYPEELNTIISFKTIDEDMQKNRRIVFSRFVSEYLGLYKVFLALIESKTWIGRLNMVQAG